MLTDTELAYMEHRLELCKALRENNTTEYQQLVEQHETLLRAYRALRSTATLSSDLGYSVLPKHRLQSDFSQHPFPTLDLHVTTQSAFELQSGPSSRLKSPKQAVSIGQPGSIKRKQLPLLSETISQLKSRSQKEPERRRESPRPGKAPSQSKSSRLDPASKNSESLATLPSSASSLLSKYVFVVIDGGHYQFWNPLIVACERGAKQVAETFEPYFINQLKLRDIKQLEGGPIAVVIRIYVSFELLELSLGSTVQQPQEAITRFATALHAANLNYHFTDAGRTQNMVTDSIATEIHAACEDSRCLHIYFGASQDLKHKAMLKQISELRDRVTLVRTPLTHWSYDNLNINNIPWPKIELPKSDQSASPAAPAQSGDGLPTEAQNATPSKTVVHHKPAETREKAEQKDVADNSGNVVAQLNFDQDTLPSRIGRSPVRKEDQKESLQALRSDSAAIVGRQQVNEGKGKMVAKEDSYHEKLEPIEGTKPVKDPQHRSLSDHHDGAEQIKTSGNQGNPRNDEDAKRLADAERKVMWFRDCASGSDEDAELIDRQQKMTSDQKPLSEPEDSQDLEDLEYLEEA